MVFLRLKFIVVANPFTSLQVSVPFSLYPTQCNVYSVAGVRDVNSLVIMVRVLMLNSMLKLASAVSVHAYSVPSEGTETFSSVAEIGCSIAVAIPECDAGTVGGQCKHKLCKHIPSIV